MEVLTNATIVIFAIYKVYQLYSLNLHKVICQFYHFELKKIQCIFSSIYAYISLYMLPKYTILFCCKSVGLQQLHLNLTCAFIHYKYSGYLLVPNMTLSYSFKWLLCNSHYGCTVIFVTNLLFLYTQVYSSYLHFRQCLKNLFTNV